MSNNADFIYEMTFGERAGNLFGQTKENRNKMLAYCVNNNKLVKELSQKECEQFGMEGVY